MSGTTLQMLGVNLAGAEFGAVGQAYGTGYTYPTHAEIDYEAAKGLNVIRVPFLWERLQPTLDGALNSAELARLDDVVNYATSKGLTVDLDVHDYGSYNGQLVGSGAVPNSAFADLWSKIATHYVTNPNVMFGLMNEPAQSNASGWLQSVNAAIGAIRAAGAVQEVLVPGIDYDGAWTWTSSQNAAVLGTGVVDPLHNYAFEVHQYLDSDGSGTHQNVISSDIGMERLQAVTQWAETTGSRLFLGEFGVANDPTSLAALKNMLTYMSQNAQAWQGGTYWAAGPWWGNYMYSAEPSNGVDAAQMTVLEQFKPNSTNPATSAPPAVNPASSASIALPASSAGASASSSAAPLIASTNTGTPGTSGVAPVSTGSGTASAASSPKAPVAASANTSTTSSDPGASGTPMVAITSVAEASNQASQTIAGMVTSAGRGVADETVTLTDNSNALATTTTDASGNFTAQVIFPNQGQNSIVATETDRFGNMATSNTVTDTLDTAPPAIVFDPRVKFSSSTTATLTGTVADNFGVASVELFEGSTDLGAATLNPNGTWSLTTDFAPGFHSSIYAVATDTSGNSASAPSNYDLTTGVTGQAYTAVQDRYGPDSFLGQTFFKRHGAVYLASTYQALPDGGSSYTYSGGTFFNDTPYSSYTDTYGPSGDLRVQIENNTDGSHTINGVGNGQALSSIAQDTFTGDGHKERFVFSPGFGHDTITDFHVGGPGRDTLVLPSADLARLAQIIGQAHTINGNTTFHIDRQDTITLQGVTAAELKAHPDDFKFHG